MYIKLELFIYIKNEHELIITNNLVDMI